MLHKASAADVDVLCDADDAAARAPRSPWLARAKVWGVLFLVQLAYCEWHVLAKQALSTARPAARVPPRARRRARHARARAPPRRRARVRARRRARRTAARARVRDSRAVRVRGHVGFIVALQYITALNSALLHPAARAAYALGRAPGSSRSRARRASACCCARRARSPPCSPAARRPHARRERPRARQRAPARAVLRDGRAARAREARARRGLKPTS